MDGYCPCQTNGILPESTFHLFGNLFRLRIQAVFTICPFFGFKQKVL